MPISVLPPASIVTDFGGFTADDFGDFSSPMNNANFWFLGLDRLSRDYDGLTGEDFGDFSSPMTDGDYQTFASPGALSNDFGTF